MFSIFNKFFRVLFEANIDGSSGGGSTTDNQNEDNNTQEEQQVPTFKTFDEYYKSLSDEHKKIVDPAREHFDRVYSSVKNVREERDTFSNQLKDLRKQLEGNTEAQGKVDDLSKSLDEANKKADFFAEAYGQECRNPKAAYAFAVSNNLFMRSGTPDWKEIKAQVPELFGQKVSKKSTAGSGAANEQPKTGSFNDWIRREAGRGEVVET